MAARANGMEEPALDDRARAYFVHQRSFFERKKERR